MPRQHFLERFIHDERSALAIARALGTKVLYVTNEPLLKKMRTVWYDEFNRTNITFGFGVIPPSKVTLLCACENCRVSPEFKDYDEYRKHLFKRKSAA